MLSFALLLFQSAPAGGGMLGQLLPIVLMFAIAYFLILRPIQNQKKKQQEMLKTLQNGQNVLTTGGIMGTIVSVNSDDTLILRVKPDGVKIQVARSAVTTIVTGEEGVAKK